jgi:hypothetical protein
MNHRLQLDTTLPVGSTNGTLNVSNTRGTIYQIPINVSPGTGGIQPNLSIVYNSKACDGLLGMGWIIARI